LLLLEAVRPSLGEEIEGDVGCVLDVEMTEGREAATLL
jgi:hypothetical protein